MELMSPEQLAEVDWREAKFTVQCTLKSVYFQAGSFGPVMEINSMLLIAESPECPFENPAFADDE